MWGVQKWFANVLEDESITRVKDWLWMALFHTKGKCIVQLFDYVFCVFEFTTIRGF